MIKNIKDFFGYVLAYWTHYTVFQIRRNQEGFMDPDTPYLFLVEVKLDSKRKELLVGSIDMKKGKPREKTDEKRIIMPGG